MARITEQITGSFHLSLATAYQLIGGLAASPVVLSAVTVYLLIQRVVAPLRTL
jgi:hypothetical protein